MTEKKVMIVTGEASGDMKLAMSCINDGVEHTPATNAKYLASQMKDRKSVV